MTQTNTPLTEASGDTPDPGRVEGSFAFEVVFAGCVAMVLAVAIAFLPAVAVVGLLAAAVVAAVVLFGYSVEVFILVLLVGRASVDGVGAGRSLSPASLIGVVVIGTAVVWLALRPRARPHPRSVTQLGILGYAAAAGLSVLVSLRPGTSLIEFLRLASAVAVFLIIDRLLAQGASERRLLAALLGSAAVPLLVAVLDLVRKGSLETKGDFDRLSSTFVQSNGFSRYLMLMIVMGLASMAVWRTATHRVLVLAGCGLAAVALLLTYTRASWIGATVGVAVVALTSRRYRKPAAATAVVLAVALAPFVAPRFADLGESDLGVAAVSSSNSLEWRLNYWDEIIGLADDSPINGIGLGSTAKMTAQAKQPHSELVRAYVELGVVGLAAYVVFIGALLRTGVVAVRSTSGSARRLAIGYLATVISFAVVSLVTNAFSQTALLWYLFAFSALMVALSRRRADELSEGPLVRTVLQSRWAVKSPSEIHLVDG